MRLALSAFLVGMIFALGLGVSGMTDPRKVIGFLDVFGAWDPSLLMVMIGALAVYVPVYHFTRAWRTPVLESQWHKPEATGITRGLVVGSLLFGIGWGLAGYCPGPAVVSLMKFTGQPLAFVLAMLLGFFVARRLPWS